MTDTKIKIIGKDYDVKFVDPYAPELQKLDLNPGERSLGLTMYFEDAIYIVNDLCPKPKPCAYCATNSRTR